MDLLSILPNFPTKPYTHLLPSLERAKLTTTDLITLDTLEVAKRAHLPPTDIRRFAAHIIEALHGDVGFERKLPENVQLDASVSFDGPVEIEPGSGTEVDLEEWRVISTLDEGVDEVLDGGLPTGYLTEVTGESGSGKTQFLLFLLLSVQLPSPKGLQKRAIYISTEAPLSTPRLTQMLNTNPHLSTLPPSQKPSLTNILSINAMDLESQDHILNYQVPIAVKRYNIGLIVIDSLTANYRAEHTSTTMAALSSRSAELARLGHLLRCLAVNEDIAVVVANQVSDRFGDTVDSMPGQGPGPGTFALRALRESGAASPAQRTISGGSGPGGGDTIPSSSPAIQSSPFMDEDQTEGSGNSARNEILSLLHQQRFFTGWGDSRKSNADSVGTGMGYGVQKPSLKTPALGLVWSTQIACRIALKKMVSDSDCSERVVFGGESQTSKEGESGEVRSGRESSQHNAGPEPGGERKTRRILKLVMAPWTGGSEEGGRIRDEVEFEIWKSGLRSRRRD